MSDEGEKDKLNEKLRKIKELNEQMMQGSDDGDLSDDLEEEEMKVPDL